MRLEDVSDRCAAVAKSLDSVRVTFLAQHVNRRQLSRRACPRAEQGRGGERRGAVAFASISMSCDNSHKQGAQLVATVGAAAAAKNKRAESAKGAKGGAAGKQCAKKPGAASVKEDTQPGGAFSLPFLLGTLRGPLLHCASHA
jgi:hypothetical protein